MDETARLQARLKALDEERAAVIAALDAVATQQSTERRQTDAISRFSDPPITATSPTGEKVALFRRLFAGREDVFPLRWENRKTGRGGYSPACGNEWKRGLCGKPQVKCGECAHQAFLAVTDEVIDKHLRGALSRSDTDDFVAGVYPLLADESCRFLAADFDKESWAADALAMMETCRLRGVPAALERSRSGNGGHVWIFFADAVSARTARALGASLLTDTMERRPEIGFASYDRFFPSQDTMPLGGFGNLIALPLQARPPTGKQPVRG